MEDYYPEGVREFRTMLQKHDIHLPQGLSKGWSNETITAMAEVAYNLPHMWRHAIGEDWQQKVTLADIEALFRRM